MGIGYTVQTMKYLHPDNIDKPYKDWRLPENRVQMCLRSYAWRMKHRDVDHYTYNEAYMTRGALFFHAVWYHIPIINGLGYLVTLS